MARIFRYLKPTVLTDHGFRRVRQHQGEQGASLVEFALVAPLLLIITFGVIEFGVMLYNQQVITNAARKGARRGIVQQAPSRIDGEEIADTVSDYADDHVISFLSTAGPPEVTTSVTCDVGTCAGNICNKFGDNLAVTVSYTFHYLVIGNLVPGLGNGINLRSTATMKCE